MDQYIKDHVQNLTESDKVILLKCKEIQERVKKIEKSQSVQKGTDKARRKGVQHELLEHNKKKRKLEETVKDAEFKLNEVRKGVQFELNSLGEFKCDHKFMGTDNVDPKPQKSLFSNSSTTSVSRSGPFGTGSSEPTYRGFLSNVSLPKQCIYCDKYV